MCNPPPPKDRATQVWLPTSTSQWLQTKLLQLVEGKPPQVMQPKHRILEQSPTVRGDFIEKVRTGKIVVHRGGVERFTGDGLILSAATDEAASSTATKQKPGEHLPADVVISCTGYDAAQHHRFLPSDVMRGPDTPAHRVDLYKLMVSPRHAGLFVLGHAETVGALAPVVDAQARWACAVLRGRIQLPSPDRMRTETHAFHAWQARHFLQTERHALAVHVVRYVDELLAPLGAAPRFGKCLGRVLSSGHPWQALKVLNAVWFGIPSAAQWRLFGHGAKEALATATLLRIAAGGDRLSDGEATLLAVK